MAYLCLDCGETFEKLVMKDIEKRFYEMLCPIKSCTGHVYDRSSTYI